MAWIELHQSLPKHTKMKRLRRELKVSIPQAMGHVTLLWLWALDYAPDGDLSELTPEDIAEECMWTGKKPEVFVQALVDSGFIDADMHIHDWESYTARYQEYQEKLENNRVKSRERMRNKREKDRNCYDNVTRNNDVTDENENVTVTECSGIIPKPIPKPEPIPKPLTNKYTTHSNLPTLSILTVAGIKNRGPSAAEEEFEKKCQDRGYGEDMIRLAYDITVKATGEYKVQYIAAIMERWHSEGIHTIEQAKQDTESRRKKGTSYSSETFDHDDFFQAALKRG